MEDKYTMATIFSKKEFDFSVIYKLTSPSGKIYIGQTQCMYKRFRDYRKPKANEYLMKAILKYGLENISVEILEKDVELGLLDEREQFYLDTLKPFNDNGYNICKEASTTRGRKRPKEELIGTSEYMKTRVGALNSFYGKTHTEEVREKIRESQTGRKQSEETIQKRLDNTEKTSNKCIKQIDLITKEVIAEFSSVKEASLASGANYSTISSVANKTKMFSRGKYRIAKSAGGFYWEFCLV